MDTGHSLQSKHKWNNTKHFLSNV